MRILFIAPNTNWGGDNVALINIISGLLKKHFTIKVVVPKENGRLCEELKKLHVDYVSPCYYSLSIYNKVSNPFKFLIRNIRSLFYTYRAKIKIGNEIRSFCPDIVHTNVGPLDVALDECKKLNIPHIWHLREYQDLDFNMTFFPSKKYFYKRIHTLGNFNVAITKGIFDYWKLDDSKDAVIYDGVFSSEINITDIKKKNYFLFVGRVNHSKGLHSILEPFKSFLKIHPDFKLLIAGSYNNYDGYYLSIKQYIEENSLVDNVILLGERRDVYDLMKSATAIIIPSISEGFGFIAVEAMLNMCYIIGRNTAGIKEQFDRISNCYNNDCFYRFNTEKEILDGMLYAINNNTHDKCMNAQKFVFDNYSIEKNISTLVDYYNTLQIKRAKW